MSNINVEVHAKSQAGDSHETVDGIVTFTSSHSRASGTIAATETTLFDDTRHWRQQVWD